MKNPQTENGYTRIANELMEALARIRVSGEARQCLDVILRKTYGFNKKSDFISLSQFSLYTGLPRITCAKNVKKLILLNLVTVTQKGYRGINSYRFNKDYSSWRPLPKKVTVTQKGNLTVTQKGTHKRNIQKKDIPAKADSPKKDKPKDNIGTKYFELMVWGENRRGGQFPNRPKQMASIKKMHKAGIGSQKIKDRWEEMELDRWWNEKGFDFKNVADSFDKKL